MLFLFPAYGRALISESESRTFLLAFVCLYFLLLFQPAESATVVAAREGVREASVALQSCSSLRLWYLSRMLHRSMQLQRVFLTFVGAKLTRSSDRSVHLQHAAKHPGVYAWYSQFRRSIEVRREVDRLANDVASKKPGASADLKRWTAKLNRVVDIQLPTQQHSLPSLRQMAPGLVEALLNVHTPFPYDEHPLLTHILYGDGIYMRQIVGACTVADNVLLTGSGGIRANPGRAARSEKRKAHNQGSCPLVCTCVYC